MECKISCVNTKRNSHSSSFRRLINSFLYKISCLFSVETFRCEKSALGSRINHGTSWIAEIIHWIILPNVRPHLRKVSKEEFLFNQKIHMIKSFCPLHEPKNRSQRLILKVFLSHLVNFLSKICLFFILINSLNYFLNYF